MPHSGPDADEVRGDEGDLADRVDAALRAAWSGDMARLGPLAGGDDGFRDVLEPLIHAEPDLDLPLADVPGYRVLREIGHGGMGAVHEAEQLATGSIVALKRLPRVSRGDPVREHLFEREVLTLARLRHPGIATIFDAGTTPDGTRWFAMEKVDGERLDVAARLLPIDERVRLLVQVAEAIQYAHSALVVHRDLKPSNVLVDERGDPRVLDFGLAHAGDRDDVAVAGAGTLAYSSPEQVLGRPEALLAGTDLYALGVIAFEVLRAARAFPDAELSRDALRTLVVDRGIPDPLATRPSLDGDLAAIVRKAAARDRRDRYASAGEFADDLRRWLRHEPVAAQPPRRIHALRLFTRRHRTLVVATAFSVTMLALAVAFTTRSWLRSTAALARTRSIVEFSEKVFVAVDPRGFSGANVTVFDLLARSADQLDHADDVDPVARAHLERLVGRAYRQICVYPRAERFLRSAIERLRRDAPDDLVALAACQHELALILHASERFDDALREYEAALHLRDATLGRTDPATIEHREDLARLSIARGESERALRYATEAAADARAGGDPRSIAKYTIELGRRLLEVGDRAGARSVLIDVLAFVRTLDDADLLVADAIDASSGLAYTTETVRAQLPLLDEMLSLRRRVLGPEHLVVAESLALIARQQMFAAEPELAEATIEEALAIAKRRVESSHPFHVQMLEMRAAIAAHFGKRERALLDRRAVVELTRQREPPARRSLVVALCALAACQVDDGRADDALVSLAEARAVLASEPGSHPTLEIDLAAAEATAMTALRRFAEAARCRDLALRRSREHFGASALPTLAAMNAWIESLCDAGDLDAARAACEQAVALASPDDGECRLRALHAIRTRIAIERDAGDTTAERVWLGRALALTTGNQDVDTTQRADWRSRLESIEHDRSGH